LAPPIARAAPLSVVATSPPRPSCGNPWSRSAWAVYAAASRRCCCPTSHRHVESRPRRAAGARPAARWCVPPDRLRPAALNCAVARGVARFPAPGHPGALMGRTPGSPAAGTWGRAAKLSVVNHRQLGTTKVQWAGDAGLAGRPFTPDAAWKRAASTFSGPDPPPQNAPTDSLIACR
jgi:hypothetical protein